MRLVDLLSEELVIPDAKASGKEALLAELVAHVARVRPSLDGAEALRVLVARERLGSTGVGNGLAIPHGKIHSTTTMFACFARSATGVEFGALDGRPVHLVLTLLSPEGPGGFHLKALARASRLFKDPTFRTQLVETAQRRALFELLRDKDRDLEIHP